MIVWGQTKASVFAVLAATSVAAMPPVAAVSDGLAPRPSATPAVTAAETAPFPVDTLRRLLAEKDPTVIRDVSMLPPDVRRRYEKRYPEFDWVAKNADGSPIVTGYRVCEMQNPPGAPKSHGAVSAWTCFFQLDIAVTDGRWIAVAYRWQTCWSVQQKIALYEMVDAQARLVGLAPLKLGDHNLRSLRRDIGQESFAREAKLSPTPAR